MGGLSPACRVPILQFATHIILAFSLIVNLGWNINLNVNGSNKEVHMDKTTNTKQVVVKKSTGLGCVGKRVRKSG